MELKRVQVEDYIIKINDNVFMDLDDEFTNRCLLPRTEQIAIINNLLTQAADMPVYNEIYENNLIVHLYIIKVLSEYAGKSDVLIISSELFNSEVAQYIESFGKDNIINLISNDELNYDKHYYDTIKEYLMQLKDENQKYHLVIADFRNISDKDSRKYILNQSIDSILEELLEYNGYLILGYRKLEIYKNTRRTSTMECDFIRDLLAEVNMSIFTCNNYNAAGLRTIIDRVSEVEKYVLQNRENKNMYGLEYAINELKTSLIDYYISDGRQPQVIDDVKRNACDIIKLIG